MLTSSHAKISLTNYYFIKGLKTINREITVVVEVAVSVKRKICKTIRFILYATNDGFAIP